MLNKLNKEQTIDKKLRKSKIKDINKLLNKKKCFKLFHNLTNRNNNLSYKKEKRN